MLNAQLRISDVKMSQSGSTTRLLYLKQLKNGLSAPIPAPSAAFSASSFAFYRERKTKYFHFNPIRGTNRQHANEELRQILLFQLSNLGRSEGG